MVSRIFRLLFRNKIILAVILLCIAAGGYFGYQKIFTGDTPVRYVLAAVEKGTLMVMLSGSGQVSATNQVDIKPKVSGDIISLYIKNGQEVKIGALIAKIDDTDAQKAVRDARLNLESTQLDLEKLKKPADALALLQAENSLIKAKNDVSQLKLSQNIAFEKAQETKQKAEDNLKRAYDDGFNTVADAFLDLPTAIAGLQDILFSFDLENTQWNADYYFDQVKKYNSQAHIFRDDAQESYRAARISYDQNFNDYKSASRFSNEEDIESLINETYATVKNIAEAVKSANNLIQLYQDEFTEHTITPHTLSNTHLSSINAYTGITNNHLLNLLAIQRSIQDNKEAILNANREIQEMEQNNPLNFEAAERTVMEREESLAELVAGTDEFDLRAKNIALEQKENVLREAQANLADYYIRAPFDGVVADVPVKKGESVSSGTVLASLVSHQKIAEITLNEVDAAKVATKDKATLSFDAIEDLTISGEIVEISMLGEVSQGVVSYGVKISFDTQDEQIKPGMSVTAAIITDMKQNVLLVPSAAIKQQGEETYVQVADNSAAQASNATANIAGILLSASSLQSKTIQTGLSNDTMIEITGGLEEGDQVIIQTITSDNTESQSSQNTGFQFPGMGSGSSETRDARRIIR